MPDYEKLGFRCGLEIHQQLSGTKLFCACPAINSAKEPDMRVQRRLRAVAGETGEVDQAASHEMKKSLLYEYVANSEDTCLVELDEEPAHPVNQDALAAAVEVAALLHARIVDEVRVMRKTVVDGSNVSGFQRTALVGMDGHIETSQGRVGIPTICLEEEAAQKLSQTGEKVVYRLDRLGIPLVEIATDSSIKSPAHAKECAEKLGMVLRSTGRVKRGIGTIRQDVNISIKGGARTEVKGFQDLRSIPKVIENEVKRQLSAGRHKPQVRKAEPDFTTSYLRPMPGAARMYPETDVLPVRPPKPAAKAELIGDRAKRYMQMGLAEDLAMQTAKSESFRLFERIAAGMRNRKPSLAAEAIISYRRVLTRDYQGCDPARVSGNDLSAVILAADRGEITVDSIMPALADAAKGGLNLVRYRAADPAGLDEDIKRIVAQNKGAGPGAIMGEIMKKYRGRVDGKAVMEKVRNLLGQ